MASKLKRIASIAGVGLTAAFVAGLSSGAGPGGVAHAGPATGHIEHVIVIYQENHSFDETLGALCNETSPKRCDGYVGPVTLSNGTVVPVKVEPDKVPLAGHGVTSQAKAINNGAMDGWQAVGHCKPKDNYGCVTHIEPSGIPNLAALARQYTISDRTFSMARSPSYGGHVYVVAASLDGFEGTNPRNATDATSTNGWGCDSNTIAPWISPAGARSWQPACIPDPTLAMPNGGAYKPTPVQYIPTIMNRLDDAGKSWKLYVAPKTAGSHYAWSICPTFAECLYKHADHMVEPKTILTDAASGNLPNYAVVTPNGPGRGGTSQHNGNSMLNGDNWIGQMVTALQNGPEWDSTAIFITYDDCGCFYDHVAPGVNADGSKQGPRVPMVIVSPWAKPGFTDSGATSIVGILSFVEHTFGLTPLNVVDQNAYDYSNSFDFTQTPTPPVPMKQSVVPKANRNLDSSFEDPT